MSSKRGTSSKRKLESSSREEENGKTPKKSKQAVQKCREKKKKQTDEMDDDIKECRKINDAMIELKKSVEREIKLFKNMKDQGEIMTTHEYNSYTKDTQVEKTLQRAEDFKPTFDGAKSSNWIVIGSFFQGTLAHCCQPFL